MTTQLLAHTCYNGSFPVSETEITDNMIFAFRKGGCAALASALHQMIPGSSIVLYCEAPVDDDLDALEYWGHAGVRLPEGDVLEIGGLNNWSHPGCNFEYDLENPDLMPEVVDQCPPQPPTAVLITATNLVRSLNIPHRQVVSYPGEGAGGWF